MKKILASISMIALLGAGCSYPTPAENPIQPDKPSEPAGKMSMAQFLVGQWSMKSMQRVGGELIDLSELNLVVSFDGGQMAGKL